MLEVVDRVLMSMVLTIFIMRMFWRITRGRLIRRHILARFARITAHNFAAAVILAPVMPLLTIIAILRCRRQGPTFVLRIQSKRTTITVEAELYDLLVGTERYTITWQN